MNYKTRHLITTSDERTWKFNQPVLFLGEWCKSYDKKHLWQPMDALTLCPLGHGQAEKDVLYGQARAFEAEIFPILVEVLNQHHRLEYSKRAWRILIGPWLRRNVDVLFNRLTTLQKCLDRHRISGMTVIQSTLGLAPPDALNALEYYGRDDWNAMLFARMLEIIKSDVPIEWLPNADEKKAPEKKALPLRSLWKHSLRWMVAKSVHITRFFTRDHDAFFINTYLPAFEQVKLQLAMGQFPQFWTIPSLVLENKVEPELRHLLSSYCVNKWKGEQLALLGRLVIETLPSCYLEEFSTLKKTVENLPFPVMPRFIFTSNNFEANEVFQLWVALKVESGSKYYVGQHGNNYGTYRYMRYTIEEETSDRFLTWGWRAGLEQHTPAFNFKMSSKKRLLRQDSQGGLLLVENILGHRIYVWDRPHDFENYLQEQMSFVHKLEPHIKAQLIVRLHYTHASFNACEPLRWQDSEPSVKVDDGTTPYPLLVEKSRLVIYGYDSTGILESLALNLPTMVLMENGFEFLQDDALPYYKALFEAGVIHTSPESAARQVNAIWNRLDDWWYSSEVQKAREAFCNQYSKLSNTPVRDLITVFRANARG